MYFCNIIMKLRAVIERITYQNGENGYSILKARVKEYESTELDELSLAYATTIHKNQGSEYPIVVIPVHFTNYVMLQRNLIYTAVTRAKIVCIVIVQKRALYVH